MKFTLFNDCPCGRNSDICDGTRFGFNSWSNVSHIISQVHNFCNYLGSSVQRGSRGKKLTKEKNWLEVNVNTYNQAYWVLWHTIVTFLLIIINEGLLQPAPSQINSISNQLQLDLHCPTSSVLDISSVALSFEKFKCLHSIVVWLIIGLGADATRNW